MNIYIIRMRTIIIAALIILAVPAAFLIPEAIEAFSSSDGRNLPVYCVDTPDNKIALTFDCAWNDSDISSILDTLSTYNIYAAFFVTGDWAEKYPDAMEQIRNAGHIIGNHSYDHADYTTLNADEISADIAKADEVIGDTLYFRAPSGGYNDTVIASAESMGKICVQWSIDSLDYKSNATEESILARLGKTKSGDIILMHNGTELSAKLLGKIIRGLGKNYEFVSLDELIYREDFEINHEGKQIRK